MLKSSTRSFHHRFQAQKVLSLGLSWFVGVCSQAICPNPLSGEIRYNDPRSSTRVFEEGAASYQSVTLSIWLAMVSLSPQNQTRFLYRAARSRIQMKGHGAARAFKWVSFPRPRFPGCRGCSLCRKHPARCASAAAVGALNAATREREKTETRGRIRGSGLGSPPLHRPVDRGRGPSVLRFLPNRQP